MESNSFITKLGACFCDTLKAVVKVLLVIFHIIFSAIKKTVYPLIKDIAKLIRKIIKNIKALSSKGDDSLTAKLDNFKRRKGIFGIKKAVYLGYCELKLAFKRKGGFAKFATNVVFPICAVICLVVVVKTTMSQSYVITVEYDGEEIGVITGDDVIIEAQSTVADVVKYYDTGDDYYVTATLSLKPLASNEETLDVDELAYKMEETISNQYDFIDVVEEIETFEVVDDADEDDIYIPDGYVLAYKVTVDGSLLGFVEDNTAIDKALNKLKAGYNTGEYDSVDFNKSVVYDKAVYIDPVNLSTESELIEILTGYETEPEYYEVASGDNLWKIAQLYDMEVSEIAECYATYEGQVVELGDNIKVGTLIQIDSETPYLQVECSVEVTYRKSISYETITIEDDTLAEGETIVEREGQDGEKYIQALVTYRDGVMIKRKVIDSIIVEQPVSEIIRVGPTAVTYATSGYSSEGGSGQYYWPVEGGTVTAGLGDNRTHKGMDIAAPLGTPVYAAASGTVIDVGSGWNGGYGNSVMIKNDDGNITVYAHLSETATEVDAVVEEGQLIGYVGSTGDSSGNHLHFEVRTYDGKYMDPETFVSQD